jgi:hypothetical protein
LPRSQDGTRATVEMIQVHGRIDAGRNVVRIMLLPASRGLRQDRREARSVSFVAHNPKRSARQSGVTPVSTGQGLTRILPPLHRPAIDMRPQRKRRVPRGPHPQPVIVRDRRPQRDPARLRVRRIADLAEEVLLRRDSVGVGASGGLGAGVVELEDLDVGVGVACGYRGERDGRSAVGAHEKKGRKTECVPRTWGSLRCT